MSVESTAPDVDRATDEREPAQTGVAVGRPSAVWILLAGLVGLLASFTLMVEKVELLIDPAYVPSCNMNPVLSCGSVMNTPQAGAFGFPNPLIGVIAFTVVIVTGVLVVAKVRLPQWYWVGLAIGTALGAAFVHYLIFQSLYRIGALCPYCMVVWAVTIPLLAVVASVALRPLAGNPVLRVIYQWRWSIVTLWFTALFLMSLVRFWDYWSTLI
ncbi:vitamin K epoxide reductase family protein [[Mycobacterium] burgundiense]|uniref:Vitamin K epoxide reductase family protein n=1 Tax=[Mycobacterium] burgundiense TaxID=3064286 RepID=A0ABN9NNL7_9MYCO|nr:vitamin K epoxide reductase family protein [Mycolicibacterium sp. MU0053]CAJ1506628.1 vitamin K epoxide reductase family protein [Mycolicibacterium sp. MU0053]